MWRVRSAYYWLFFLTLGLFTVDCVMSGTVRQIFFTCGFDDLYVELIEEIFEWMIRPDIILFTFNFLQRNCPNGISLMGNSGCQLSYMSTPVRLTARESPTTNSVELWTNEGRSLETEQTLITSLQSCPQNYSPRFRREINSQLWKTKATFRDSLSTQLDRLTFPWSTFSNALISFFHRKLAWLWGKALGRRKMDPRF